MRAIFLVLCSAVVGVGAEPIDGRSVNRWQAQPGWTPSRMARGFALSEEGGWLAFSAEGQGGQMTWTLSPAPAELAGEPRWMVVRYRASGLPAGSGETLLSVQAGDGAWIGLASYRSLIADGAEHAVAVDVESYDLPAPVEKILLRLGPMTAAQGKLAAKIEFCDRPPDGAAQLSRKAPPPETVRFEFEKFKWQPSANWVPRPPETHRQEATAEGVRFGMTGRMRSMRWTSRLPGPLDLRRMPYVAVRYRAKGDFGPSGYVFYLGTGSKDPKTRSIYAMAPGDVLGDGQWHVHVARLENTETPSGAIAVGIDSLSPGAEIELDWIAFSSLRPRVPLDDALGYQTRGGAWRAGSEGLTVLAPPAAQGSRAQWLRRLGLSSWFRAADINLGGVPFRVAQRPEDAAATGTIDIESLEAALPGAAKPVREILLLLAAAFPRAEPFGSSAKRDTPLRCLDEPERLALEIRYADGTSDQMLPTSAATGQYGVGRDIGLYAVRPAAGKTPVSLLLHDRMRNAAFALLGVTLNTGTPRCAEPEAAHVWYKRPPFDPFAQAPPATIAFETAGGLAWKAIRSRVLGSEGVDLAGKPVFRLLVDKQEIPSTDFRIDEVEQTRHRTTIAASLRRDGLHLEARLKVLSDGGAESLVSLALRNVGAQPVTGTLLFPTVSGVRLGDVSDTWYFVARRGGVINRIPAEFRDEIGEAHPLAVDGFFSPALGGGVAFMPRDLEGVFRWYRVGKDAAGGSYALEYLPQTIAPGQAWPCVPVAVAALRGDWHDQLDAYGRWVDTWYKPLVPRKEWFRNVWAIPSLSPSRVRSESLDERLDFVGMAQRRNRRIPGATDYEHFFGWAMTKEFGHWGAYDHYHELGGLARFRRAIAEAQQAGLRVGLYLDGYLVSTRSDKPAPAQVGKWAVREADGRKLYHQSYDAHSMCPYVKEWRDYLCGVYRRVAAELRPDGMYLDEFGKCMTSRICSSPDHGHPVPMGMCPGEWILSREVRQAVPPEIATYCEFVPADVASQYLDGAYGHVALDNHRNGYGRVAEHFVDLHRFALPDFKIFELIYYVPLANGNWYLLKYPFFNGNGYYLTGQELDGYDDASRAFLTRVFKIQKAHADAFTSADVEPLAQTEAPGLYANRFSTAKKTVWTLFNANYRTLRGALVEVPDRPGAKYYDAWNERPVAVRSVGERRVLELEIGPRAVGCVAGE